MTTGTGELPSLSARVVLAFQGMATNRVPLFYASQPRMATDAQIVNRFVQLKTVATCMGVMAGNTPDTQSNAMRVKTYALFSYLFLVTMTTNAKVNFAVRPELKLVGVAMGVVADGAVTGTNRPMDMLLAFDFNFVSVTLETYLVDSTREHGDFGVSVALSVAAHA